MNGYGFWGLGCGVRGVGFWVLGFGLAVVRSRVYAFGKFLLRHAHGIKGSTAAPFKLPKGFKEVLISDESIRAVLRLIASCGFVI